MLIMAVSFGKKVLEKAAYHEYKVMKRCYERPPISSHYIVIDIFKGKYET